MQKINVTGLEARNKAIAGMSYVATAIKSTIGPFGLNFLLEKGNKITNDGYTISAELCPTIKDEFERRGALVAHEASSKTNDMVGDATSTAWAFTDAIVKEAVRYLPNDRVLKAKKTPSQIIQDIEVAKNLVLVELEKMITPITNKEELIKSAMVSVENEELAQLLGETQFELGPNGVIIAEEVNEPKSSIERVKGVRLDNGFANTTIVNNPEKRSFEINDISIILTNYTIGVEELKKLQPTVINPLVNQKKTGLVIMARAFTPEAIQLCMDTLKAGFGLYPMNAPYTDQREIMQDIAVVTGARYIDNEDSLLDDMSITDVGFCTRLVAEQFSAVITGVDDEKSLERAAKRVEVLKKEIDGYKSEFMRKAIEARIAQLESGFAILKVGSHSVTDRKRLKDKCDDAVNAVRLALKGGTVRGAGQAFKEISDNLTDDNILKRPLTCVYDQIMSSAPDDFEIPEWVRDPYLVLKCALENACAFAGTFASVNGIITTADKKTKKEIDLEDEE